MPFVVSNRCSQNPSRPASKQHATSTALPSLAEARDRMSAMIESNPAVSPPSRRCSRNFSIFGRRAATSHDETLSSIETYAMFSDDMTEGSPDQLRTLPVLPSGLGGVLPIASGTRSQLGWPQLCRSRPPSGGRESFFKSLLRRCIFLRMIRPRLQLGELQLA